MPPRRQCKSVVLHKLDSQLDLFLRACEIQARINSARASAAPSPRLSPEQQAALRARGGKDAASLAPGAPSNSRSRDPGSPPPGGAQSVPSRSVNPDADDLGNQDDLASESQTGAGDFGFGATFPEPPDIQPKPLEGRVTEDGVESVIHLPNLKTTQSFVDLLRVAVLEGSGMLDENIQSLREPTGPEPDLVNHSQLLRSLRHFIDNALCSREHYERFRRTELSHNPKDPYLSFDQVKRRV